VIIKERHDMLLGIPPHTRSANRYVSRFPLVFLGIDGISQESTMPRRGEKLRKMAGGLELGDVYGATIEWIKG